MNELHIGERIKKKREQNGLSLQDIAEELDVNRSSVMRWENGETNRIKLPIIEKLARILKTTPQYLMGYEMENPSALQPCLPEDACLLPVLKDLCSPERLFESENILHYELADGKYQNTPCFYLIQEGDSMSPRLDEGDYLLIKVQKKLESGDLGVFLIDHRETMVRVLHHAGSMELQAFNPYYPLLRLDKEEKDRISVIGRVMESKKRW